jgi:hypothetical protein
MTNGKTEFIAAYFDKWTNDVERAETLAGSDEYFLEGLLVLSCYIGALGRLRYPQEETDWKSYKTVVWEYSGLKEIFENIDLLFFYQWPNSKLANDGTYKALKNHSDLVAIFKGAFGDENDIKNNASRYQKRGDLINLVKSKNNKWFDEGNFQKYIELFSNNQILYQFVRCEAVHNAHVLLFNRSYMPDQKRHTYKDNHQVDRQVILTTVKNMVAKLRDECVAKSKWPWEL